MTANVSNSTSDVAARTVALPASLAQQKLVIFYVFFRQWTGSAAMSKSDYKIGKGGEIPSSDVAASYGVKRLIDPKRLMIFETLKRKAVYLLETAGLPFCKGTAVPVDKAAGLAEEIRKIAEEFNRERDSFIAQLPDYYREWGETHPEFASNLPRPTAEYVAEKINADYAVVSFQPAAGGVDSTASLDRAVGGLFDEVIAEVVKRCKEVLTRSVAGKTADDLSQRTLRQLHFIVKKLGSLEFLNTGVRPIKELVMRLLVTLPTKGKFSPEEYAVLCGALGLLSNESLLREVADGRLTLDAYMQRAFPSAGLYTPPATLFSERKSEVKNRADAPEAPEPEPETVNAPEAVTVPEPAPSAPAEAPAPEPVPCVKAEDALPAEEDASKELPLRADEPASAEESAPAVETPEAEEPAPEPAESCGSVKPDPMPEASAPETEKSGEVSQSTESGEGDMSESDLEALLKSCFALGEKADEDEDAVPPPEAVPPAPAAIRLSAF